ncbi:hypothetical protein GBAR_LOCUS23562 [Geodia barretti]|nr:hypothetical protein GBAR_LOCUS23562 [Geodia barretti]
MERAVLALLCLSAAFCFASAQDLPRCPDDWLTFYAKYQRGNYAEQSQPLLVDQRCTYEVTLSFGPFVVTPTISICKAGTVSRFVAPSPLGGVYICETLRPAVDQPELAPLVVPLNADLGGSALGPAVSEATEPPTRPASVTPTEQAERPTTEGEFSECPSDGAYSRNNYIYSSL